MRSTLPMLAVPVLAAALSGLAAAQTIAVDAGFSVTPETPFVAYVTYSTNCFRSHEVEVVPRADVGLVRVIAVEGCSCPAGPALPVSFTAELGRFPVGIYHVDFVVAARDEGSPLPCAPPAVLASTEFGVSSSGSVRLVAPEPALPRPGQAVALVINTLCGDFWGPPELSGTPRERIIRVAPQRSNAGTGIAPRLTPCGNGRQTIPLGPLPAGVYRAVIGSHDGGIDVERRFVVAPEPGPPVLLHNGRFRVRGTWRDGQDLSGAAQPGTLTNETGYQWFFQRDNVETLVKVIDGCALNGRFWVFAAGLTNVETHLSVEDTQTGEVWTHTNLLQTPFAPVQDTDALHGCATGGR